MRRTLIGLGLLAAAGWLAGAARANDWADAEVRKVDREAARLTLKHGEIKSLDMPPMTMVFRVQDKAWLERLNVGDRIRFQARKVDGQYTVTAIQAGK